METKAPTAKVVPVPKEDNEPFMLKTTTPSPKEVEKAKETPAKSTTPPPPAGNSKKDNELTKPKATTPPLKEVEKAKETPAKPTPPPSTKEVDRVEDGEVVGGGRIIFILEIRRICQLWRRYQFRPVLMSLL